jgi:hypothetical protein
MHSAFSRNAYVLKRKGLAIVGKYQLLDPESSEPLLFVEDKRSGCRLRYGRIFADESKRQEVLTLKPATPRTSRGRHRRRDGRQDRWSNARRYARRCLQRRMDDH